MSVDVVRLLVEPSTPTLVDDPVVISVLGLGARQQVTVVAVVVEDGNKFVSWAHYEATDQGQVRLGSMQSSGGTYTGVEPMGLFWSLQAAPGQKRGLRLMKRDVSRPLVFRLSVLSGHWTTDVDAADHPQKLTETTIDRYYKAPGVLAFDVRFGTLRGRFFLPPGDGPFPGVIDMFGTGGGLNDIRAALLASRGFAAFCLPFFGYDDLPVGCELNLEYFVEAVKWLWRHPHVIKSGIGVIGTSKGAALAMQMAILSDKVNAVIAINPFCFSAMGVHYLAGRQQHVVNGDIDDLYETEDGLVYLKSYAFHDQHHAAVLRIEKSQNAHFLFLVGEDDLTCDRTHVQILIDRMAKLRSTASDAESRCTLLRYSGAGHLIEPPYSPLCRTCHTKNVGMAVAYGGKTKPHSVAQLDSWRRMLLFLRHRLTSDRAAQTQNGSVRDVDNRLSSTFSSRL